MYFCCENKISSSKDIIDQSDYLFDKPKNKFFDDANKVLTDCLNDTVKAFKNDENNFSKYVNFYCSDPITSYYFDLYKYDLPFWILAEYLDFGKLIFLASNTKNQYIKSEICKHFKISKFDVFKHSMMTIKQIRNVIAHFHPLLGTKLSFFSKINASIMVEYISNDNNNTIFAFILLLCKMLGACGKDQVTFFKRSIIYLFKTNPWILNIVGAPNNWLDLIKK